MSRDTLIRFHGTPEFPRVTYLKHLSRDGGFAITTDKGKARRFTEVTARTLCAELPQRARTGMNFDTCPAPAGAEA